MYKVEEVTHTYYQRRGNVSENCKNDSANYRCHPPCVRSLPHFWYTGVFRYGFNYPGLLNLPKPKQRKRQIPQYS